VREKLPDTLALMAEVLREPSFPADEFAKLQRERATDIEGRRSDPEDVASRALARYENPYPEGDVRYMPTVDEEVRLIESTRLDAVKDFYQRFAGGSYAEVSLVGDFDPAAVRTQLEKLFGDWRTAEPFTRVPNPLVVKRAMEIREETPDKANAVLAGELAMPITDMSADYPALKIANYILGGSANSRLWDRIRQREGLSYGVYSSLEASSFEPNTTLAVEAIFAPENLGRLRTALTEELGRAVKEGFTAQEIADAKKALLQERTLARAQDSGVARELVRQAYLGRTFADAARIDAQIAAATPEDVNRVLRKYVIPDAFVEVYAGDFAKKP
jgi:zinc protease